MTYEVPVQIVELGRRGYWIGVDFDGTAFRFDGGGTDHWVAWNVFGEPIAPMIERMKAWVAAGVGVKIVTARIGLPIFPRNTGIRRYATSARHKCPVSGDYYSDFMMCGAIQDHLEKHDLPRLDVQCFKDVHMIELYDDRAVQVVANTGRTLAEEHLAELEALRGKQFQGD